MISTKGRYALRVMLDLAGQPAGEAIKLKDIAERQSISVKYLEQIIAILNKAGMVRSIRGPQGGYMLSRKTLDYTVGEILRLTEGDLAPVSCVSSTHPGCDRQHQCATVVVWEKMYEAINNVIDHITLADLQKLEKERMSQI
ncbi:MAG: Rrf2 family transcriptional regulator [Lachnospiraceae bacterium]|nr:Rrf2 family transcriptional regulator [Lachnospiraceae bacterium]